MKTALAQTPLADSWGMHDVGAGWWIVMMLLMIAFWGAVIWGVVWLARGGHSLVSPGSQETPLQILDRRLADGSISVEEYEERRQVLEKSSS